MGNSTAVALHPSAVPVPVLRDKAGDVFDALLVSGGVEGQRILRLPFVDGGPASSREPALLHERRGAIELRLCAVPTLVFSAADAIDLLTAAPHRVAGEADLGVSLVYWSRLAGLVLELLAKQRFVPAVHHFGGDAYRGYWRVVIDDEDTSERLARLIEAMPPVCRAEPCAGPPTQAADLVENFLWTTVDVLVRRCLEGDELAHAIQEGGDDRGPLQVHWLRSLIRPDGLVLGAPDDRRVIFDCIGGWLSRLEPGPPVRGFRTCLRLQAPPAEVAEEGAGLGPWRMSVLVQATHDPGLVVDAERLLQQEGGEPPVLKRPFVGALEGLRSDLAAAARYFPPLAPCGQPDGPLGCNLSAEEAYAFLRDARPILESEGYRVWVPRWWSATGEARPRIRMWLHVRPEDGAPTAADANLGLDAIVGYDWRVAIGDEELSAEELRRLAEQHGHLVPLRGRWVEVQPSELATARRFLDANRGGRMTVFEALRQCYVADDLDTGVQVAGLKAEGWLGDLLSGQAAEAHLRAVEPPAGFTGALRPYQLRGLAWLSFLSRLGLGACLADDMGLGKTIQLIALLLHEREGGASPGPTLLIVPMSLVGNWVREIERFGPSLRVMVHHGLDRLTGRQFVEEAPRYDVVISTYALAHRDLEHLAAVDWHRVALDEAQNIKNPAAKQSVAIRTLPARNRLALTGTPVENRLSELWSIVDFLNRGYLGGATEFRRRFAVPIERYHDDDRAQRLRHLIRPFVLRRQKSDPAVEVDLPVKMEARVFCNLTREQAALYEATVGDMLGQIDQAGGIQRRGLILATLVKLKQLCDHPALFLKDEAGQSERSGKCERLGEMVEEAVAEGDRALIFTQFREMGSLLQRLLRERIGCDVLFLHGGTTRRHRDEIVATFQDERSAASLLILSLKAGGYGLNLTAARHVFHFDRWWNPAVEDQATDRAHRIGQAKRVQVHKFVCIGTLEERIDAMLDQKRGLAENIIGSGEEWITELSTEKLREMFALSRDAVAG